MVKFGGKIGTFYQMLKNAFKKHPLQNRTKAKQKKQFLTETDVLNKGGDVLTSKKIPKKISSCKLSKPNITNSGAYGTTKLDKQPHNN